MSFFSTIRQLDSKFSWSFFGFLFGIGGIIFGIYTTFFYEKKSSVRFDIMSNNSVYDIHENISDLDILLSGASIKKSNQTLSIVTAKLINDGSVSFTKAQYDERDPIALYVNNARILNLEITDTSNSYLREFATVQIGNAADRLSIAPAILDAGDYIAFKFLVLHNDTSNVGFRATGRIAGVKQVDIAYPYKIPTNEPFFKKAISGGLLVQLIRLLVYFFGAIILIIFLIGGVMFPIGKVADWCESKRRAVTIKQFKELHGTNNESIVVTELYQRVGLEGVIIINEMAVVRDLGHWPIHFHPHSHRALPPKFDQDAPIAVTSNVRFKISELVELNEIISSSLSNAIKAGILSRKTPHVTTNVDLLNRFKLFTEFLTGRFPDAVNAAKELAQKAIQHKLYRAE